MLLCLKLNESTSGNSSHDLSSFGTDNLKPVQEIHFKTLLFIKIMRLLIILKKSVGLLCLFTR